MARQRRGGQRMSKHWSAATINDEVVPLAQIQIGSSFTNAGGFDQTVLRCRGSLLISATPDAAADADVAAFGICVVSNEAAAAGGASLPGPINNPESDLWLWHTFVPLKSLAASAASDVALGLTCRVELDSKAMRKMPSDTSLVMVGEILTGEMGAVVVSGGWRVLFGL